MTKRIDVQAPVGELGNAIAVAFDAVLETGKRRATFLYNEETESVQIFLGVTRLSDPFASCVGIRLCMVGEYIGTFMPRSSL